MTFNLQGQGSGYQAADFSIAFINLTQIPTNGFVSSLVNVNDWYNPSWGGGFNATFRCDITAPDTQNGPVTDWLIEFNYTGPGIISTAWTQSYNGSISQGYLAPDGGYGITNTTASYQPELYAGDSITFAVQVQGAGFDENHFDVSCTDLNAPVEPANTAPVAVAQQINVAEDESVAILLSGFDDDGDALVYTIVSEPVFGTLSGAAPDLTYQPNSHYAGEDTFTFKVNDGQIDSDVVSVEIVVNPVNDVPEVTSQSFAPDEDTSQPIAVIATDVDGDVLSYPLVTPPMNGTLSGDFPSLLYTPNENYVGDDAITVSVTDGNSAPVEVTYTVSVNAVNDQPIADAISFEANENTAAPITLTGSDVDQDAVTFIVESQPSHGVLSGIAPDLIYTPDSNYNGTDTFAYRASDGVLLSDVAPVSIVVLSVNTPPSVEPLTATVNEDEEITLTLTAQDADNDTLSFNIYSQPLHGAVSLQGEQLTYTPSANYSGTDVVSYSASDGELNSATESITFTVTPVNDSPVITSQAANQHVVDRILGTVEEIDLTGWQTQNYPNYDPVRAPEWVVSADGKTVEQISTVPLTQD